MQCHQPQHSYTETSFHSHHADQKHQAYHFPLGRVQDAEFLDEGSICNYECMLCRNLRRGRYTGDQESLWLLESKALVHCEVFLLVEYVALQQEFQSFHVT